LASCGARLSGTIHEWPQERDPLPDERALRKPAGQGTPSPPQSLLASREIASRLALQNIPKRRPLDCPDNVARYLLLRYQQRDQEVMGALFLNVRHRIVGDAEIFRGTLHRAEVAASSSSDSARGWKE